MYKEEEKLQGPAHGCPVFPVPVLKRLTTLPCVLGIFGISGCKCIDLFWECLFYLGLCDCLNACNLLFTCCGSVVHLGVWCYDTSSFVPLIQGCFDCSGSLCASMCILEMPFPALQRMTLVFSWWLY